MEIKRSFIKAITITILVLISLATVTAIYFYNKIYADNTLLKNERLFYLYISSDAKLGDVTDSLSEHKILKDMESFLWVANKKNYKNIRSGRYEIKSGMSNNELVNMLRSGNQKPIKLTFNNIRTKQELASKVSQKLELDSTELMVLLNNNQFLNPFKFSNITIISMFIPNTYEFYWNISTEAFFKKMNKEYEKFWTKERLEKAKKIKMTELEVSTLASIVQAEQSIHNDEKAKVAGLYLNRLKKGMLLQSDPTVVYAIGDFSIRRVLNRDKEIDSPYNTYKYTGLPPSPINLPEISSIDAVLNYEHHNYIFMCAKEDFSGYHNFSKTTSQHMIYARRYQRELNKKKIYR
ncbi:MAG: endolytic transglycosylase MltG [Bacteroidetes bacterium]|nr:MAG: endolytic transglycosylase MltG [Bacteroidota bacterium]